MGAYIHHKEIKVAQGIKITAQVMFICKSKTKMRVKVVRFRLLEKPNKDEFSLELSKLDNYDDVKRLASHLNMGISSKIRLTSHNCSFQQPEPQPIKYRVEHLSDMIAHYNQVKLEALMDKLVLKNKGIGSEVRAERMANADVDLQLLNERERERQLKKQKKRRSQELS